MEKAIQKAIEGGWKDDLRFKTQYPEIVKGSGDILIWYVDSTNHEWTFDRITWQVVTSDPLFWQALGKAEGWKKYIWTSYKGYSDFNHKEETDDESWTPSSEYAERHITFIYHWHRFIDHLAEGKDTNEFFDNLLK